MKIKLLITMLFALCGLSTFADVTGETPTTGSSYLIYNVGQQKYLTVSGTGVSLSENGTQFAVATGTTSGTYTLTASAKLSSTFLGDIICSDNGYYTDWKFSLLSSTDKTYALGILENEDAYSFSYMYYSSVLSSIQKCSFMPDFTNGEWMFVTSTDPEVTYTLGEVTALEDMAYNATTATVKYTINASNGSVYNCTKAVTFEANDTYEAVTRSGEFTDETYKVTVPWSVKLGAKPITYTLGEVVVPTLDYNYTSTTITYTVVPSYGNNITCTHDVTFEANNTEAEVSRTGTFTDETYNLVVNWTVKLSAMPTTEKVTTVTLYQNSETLTIPSNLADYVDVYLYRTPLAANKKSSFCVPFAMTKAQLTAAFGASFNLYYYRTYDSEYNTLEYASRGSIQAGVPYIVIPDATSVESEEETAAREANTELNDSEARLYIIKNVPSTSFRTTAKTVTHGAYTYYSNLTDNIVKATFYTFDETSGVLKCSSTDREMKGFRAYFASTDAGAKALTNISFDDDWATSIDEIDADEPLTIYNVNGQLVRKDVKNTDGLAKGVYIINGKKVMIK